MSTREILVVCVGLLGGALIGLLTLSSWYVEHVVAVERQWELFAECHRKGGHQKIGIGTNGRSTMLVVACEEDFASSHPKTERAP